MSVKTILFDLDGTLLPMDQDVFSKAYISAIAKKLEPFGFDSKTVFSGVWHSVEAMVRNDGSKTNEDAFWLSFANSVGDAVLDHKGLFDEFYQTDFPKISAVCGYTEKAKTLIDMLNAKGYRLILATNPLFPAVATHCRIGCAGLQTDDFEYITSYENSYYCKPNPKYYTEILEKLQIDPTECLMVGNDVREDMITEALGMKVFLLTDCLINKDNKDISQYPHGSFEELTEYINPL